MCACITCACISLLFTSVVALWCSHDKQTKRRAHTHTHTPSRFVCVVLCTHGLVSHNTLQHSTAQTNATQQGHGIGSRATNHIQQCLLWWQCDNAAACVFATIHHTHAHSTLCLTSCCHNALTTTTTTTVHDCLCACTTTTHIDMATHTQLRERERERG